MSEINVYAPQKLLKHGSGLCANPTKLELATHRFNFLYNLAHWYRRKFIKLSYDNIMMSYI